jgi:hypothetical protein
MQTDSDDKGTRSKLGSLIVCAGLFVLALSLASIHPLIRSFKEAGGAIPFAGVARWQESPVLITFAFEGPLAFTLMLAGAGLRVSRVSARLSVGAPFFLFLTVVFFAMVLWFPTISRFFGVTGTLMAVAICLTLYHSVKRIRPENPWPGILQGTGYLSFAMLSWFLCGLATPFPGGVLYPELQPDRSLLTDIVTKIHLTVVLSWGTTAIGYLLDRKTATEKSNEAASVDGATLSPAPGPLVGATEAARVVSHSR